MMSFNTTNKIIRKSKITCVVEPFNVKRYLLSIRFKSAIFDNNQVLLQRNMIYVLWTPSSNIFLKACNAIFLGWSSIILIYLCQDKGLNIKNCHMY